MFQALTSTFQQVQVCIRYLLISKTVISISYGYVTLYVFILVPIEYWPSKKWTPVFNSYYIEQKMLSVYYILDNHPKMT